MKARPRTIKRGACCDAKELIDVTAFDEHERLPNMVSRDPKGITMGRVASATTMASETTQSPFVQEQIVAVGQLDVDGVVVEATWKSKRLL